MFNGGGGIEPSPTNDLNVSGIRLFVSSSPSIEVGYDLQNERNENDTSRNGQEPENRSPPQSLCENSTK